VLFITFLIEFQRHSGFECDSSLPDFIMQQAAEFPIELSRLPCEAISLRL
jgi:hypothetical protein